ncbi:hypothetical protein ACQP1P_38655 [Dactylosporangium sp. CA-052675]|uniref:hypothetical protein n=1 Tax=Dactylosporangium sp. CA-052675 TaxID=3239927 RepID=UPI003D94A6C4
MICMAGQHCKARDESGNPAEDMFPLCFWCLEAAERDVRALVLDYRDLEQHIPRGSSARGDGMPHARQVDAALPIDEDAFDLQREIWWVVTAWEDVVREAAALPMVGDWAKRRRDGLAVVEAVRVLAPRLEVLCRVTEAEMWGYPGTAGATVVPGWQGVLDLAALHRRARGVLGLGRDDGELIVGVACPACGIRSKLRRSVDGVSCGGCKTRLETADYAGWVLEDAAQQGGEAA